MTPPTKQTDRLREIVRQLTGIGGGRSLPDGIGQLLDMYLREKAGAMPGLEEKTNGNGVMGHKIEEESEAAFDYQPMKIGDLCPECGEAAVVNEEGCRKCYACGYSEC
jgi:ribonucleoside-diphosphate reductase alpha chain